LIILLNQYDQFNKISVIYLSDIRLFVAIRNFCHDGPPSAKCSLLCNRTNTKATLAQAIWIWIAIYATTTLQSSFRTPLSARLLTHFASDILAKQFIRINSLRPSNLIWGGTGGAQDSPRPRCKKANPGGLA